MQDKRRRSIVLAALVSALFGVDMASLRNIALGEEVANVPSFPEGTDPDGPDRLTRIEQHLRHLEANNRRLQKRYNDLARKYDQLLEQGNDPIFGAGAGNSDGTGVPGGIEWRPTALTAFLQENVKGREQTGEGGAGVGKGGRERSFQLEEDSDEEAEDAATPETPAPRERVQSGCPAAPGR